MHSTPIAPGAVILLAQPERDDRDTYTEFLRRRCFLPVPVSSAADALTIAPRVDAIVTGILLPGHLDGIGLVARLKTNDETKGIPVIVLTACSWQSDRDRAHAAGCDLFLAKPCPLDILVSEIERVLALSRVPTPKPARAWNMPKLHNRWAS